MTKKQYRHASRILRINGWDFTLRFFQNYPDRIATLKAIYRGDY